jgi:hypothetical protein
MTDREVMQQALEALEGWEHCDEWVWPVSALEQSKRNTTESLAALRAALEQQAKPTCPDCKAAVLYECVACSSNNYPPKQQQAEPPQRQWVGLTGEEKALISSVSLDVHDAVHRAEAKLKEKNT